MKGRVQRAKGARKEMEAQTRAHSEEQHEGTITKWWNENPETVMPRQARIRAEEVCCGEGERRGDWCRLRGGSAAGV